MKSTHTLPWIAVLALAPSARAQCPIFQPGFQSPGLKGGVTSLTVFDDGSVANAPLYATGNFRVPGETVFRRIARWSGASWSHLPSEPSTDVVHQSSCVYDDGSGAALYVGRSIFTGTPTSEVVARFDGTTWSYPLPPFSSAQVSAMKVFDDGNGPALYAAGSFATVGGVTMNGIVRWDGVNATPLGSGVAGGSIQSLCVYDDGAGPALYAAGTFTTAGGQPASRVARWDGASWSALGAGVDNTVSTSIVFNDGTGPALYLGGTFVTAGGSTARGIARWNGIAWSRIGEATIGGTTVRIQSLGVFDAGSGPELYAAGYFHSNAPPINASFVKRWNGTSWSSTNVCSFGTPTELTAPDMIVHDDGSGPVLVLGGSFTSIDCVPAVSVARWNGAAWSAMGEGAAIDGVVKCFTEAPLGSSTEAELFVGGAFSNAGSAHARGVARWTGSDWEAVGTVPGTVNGLAAYDDGSGAGAQLYAGGIFTINGIQNIARFDGNAWVPFTSSGLADNVNVLAVFDDGLPGGEKLFVGGIFQTFYPQTGTQAHGLASWDGKAWRALHVGSVTALHMHDDGSGAGKRLYVGGNFIAVSGVAMNDITAFDGVNFAPLGAGISDQSFGSFVSSLATFDDGTGPALFVGGTFTTAGGVTVKNIAKWDGASWSDVGGGTNANVAALAVFDDGRGGGPALFAAGSFSSAGPIAAKGIAKWDGHFWQWVDQGIFAPPATAPSVLALHTVKNGPNGRRGLFAGGVFSIAGLVPSENVALLSSCDVEPGDAFCFGDGSLATPCPCAPPNTVPNPSGASDAGCANSFHPSGGKLEAHGFVADDTVTLRASDLSPFGFVQFFVGDAESASGFAAGDGVRCADGALLRFGGQNADVGTARYPKPSIGLSLPLSAFGVPPSGGPHVRTYQALYRNPAAGFCNTSTLNVTNAYRVVWR